MHAVSPSPSESLRGPRRRRDDCKEETLGSVLIAKTDVSKPALGRVLTFLLLL